ncbi:hypothetical protein CEXT_448441 [Caerostris extrusa]|uniref:Uncharacterized protein n=1 Tax=Caerostris extrusa TaxID=172846 RepID=A0AAV4Q454_CAEEX|nr:hypothetical protein CEXT_448441 [Caerostris extrusa]
MQFPRRIRMSGSRLFPNIPLFISGLPCRFLASPTCHPVHVLSKSLCHLCIRKRLDSMLPFTHSPQRHLLTEIEIVGFSVGMVKIV